MNQVISQSHLVLLLSLVQVSVNHLQDGILSVHLSVMVLLVNLHLFKKHNICNTFYSIMYFCNITLLILFFSYFWVSVMFKPIQIADDLKKRSQ